MKKDWLLNAALVVLTTCALIVTALLVRQELFPSAASAGTPEPAEVDDWERFAARGQRIVPAWADKRMRGVSSGGAPRLVFVDLVHRAPPGPLVSHHRLVSYRARSRR